MKEPPDQTALLSDGVAVVAGRDDGAEVLLEDVLVLFEGLVGAEEEHTELLEVLADVVIHDFGVVLGADAGEVFLLCLGDAELVERLADVVRDVVPRALVAVGRADEVVDVIEVDVLEKLASPGGIVALVEEIEGAEAEVAHPLGLALHLGDGGDELGGEAAVRLEEGLFGVMEAELGLVVIVADEIGRGGGHSALLRPWRKRQGRLPFRRSP